MEAMSHTDLCALTNCISWRRLGVPDVRKFRANRYSWCCNTFLLMLISHPSDCR